MTGKEQEDEASEFFTKLSNSQEELGPEFSATLHENLWDLYQTDSDIGKDGG
jgi:hypothetical protein